MGKQCDPDQKDCSLISLLLSLMRVLSLFTLLLCGKTSLFRFCSNNCTVMILSFQTDRFEQAMKTQIRLLLEEQSDQDLHCLLFCVFLTNYPKVWF